VFSSTLQNWQTTRFMEVEVAIRLLYMLAEALPVSHGAHFSAGNIRSQFLSAYICDVGVLRNCC
ncbi:XPOT isoform 3, partial [Pan troglodytes]